MRPIKFRGRRNDNGELVYGSYVREVYSDIGTIHGIVDEGGEEFLIDEDSVAQLVGVDKNGAEVYEGDTVINPRDGTRFKAAMNHIYTVKLYIKEASDND